MLVHSLVLSHTHSLSHYQSCPFFSRVRARALSHIWTNTLSHTHTKSLTYIHINMQNIQSTPPNRAGAELLHHPHSTCSSSTREVACKSERVKGESAYKSENSKGIRRLLQALALTHTVPAALESPLQNTLSEYAFLLCAYCDAALSQREANAIDQSAEPTRLFHPCLTLAVLAIFRLQHQDLFLYLRRPSAANATCRFI